MFGYAGNMKFTEEMFPDFFGLFQAPLILRIPADVHPEVAIRGQLLPAGFGSRLATLDCTTNADKAPSVEKAWTAAGMGFVTTDDLQFNQGAVWLG
jgi:hypothetical protein